MAAVMVSLNPSRELARVSAWPSLTSLRARPTSESDTLIAPRGVRRRFPSLSGLSLPPFTPEQRVRWEIFIGGEIETGKRGRSRSLARWVRGRGRPTLTHSPIQTPASLFPESEEEIGFLTPEDPDKITAHTPHA